MKDLNFTFSEFGTAVLLRVGTVLSDWVVQTIVQASVARVMRLTEGIR